MVFGLSAIVTGGASGLGRATAALLASRGAGVVIFDLPNSNGEKVAKELGPKVIFCPGDITSVSDAKNAVELAVKECGSLQVLVNCAGLFHYDRVYDHEQDQLHSLDDFQRVININVNGTFNMLTQAAKAMAQNDENASLDLTDPMNPEVKIIQKGCIINTASVAAYEGQIGQAAYSASKGALVGLTLPAARDLAAVGIRVNTIAPGPIYTAMTDVFPKEIRDWTAAMIPFPQRLGHPDHFAHMVGAIIDNPMMNGETIRLDGAVRMPNVVL